MKTQEVLKLNATLETLSNLKGAKFAYAIAKNKEFIKTEIEALKEATKPSEEFEKYNKARIELAENHADKDEDGKSVIEGNQYKITDMDKFNKEHDKLKEEYKEALEAHKKQQDEFNALLEEETKLELQMIKIEDIPQDITVEQMEGIKVLIEE